MEEIIQIMNNLAIFCKSLIIAALLFLLAACNLPVSQALVPTVVPTHLPEIIPTETAPLVSVSEGQVSPTQAVFMPILNPPTGEAPAAAQTTPGIQSPEATEAPPATADQLAGPTLAYLFEGNIWVVDYPGASPRPLTQSAGARSFSWAPDGARLAFYTGRLLCFASFLEGTTSGCQDLGLDDYQASIDRNLSWSPDQRYIVLWNAHNPWDEGALGWIIVALDGSQKTWRIDDPVDWGASLSPDNDPGGITGQPVFLPDNRLVGTLTHRWLCGSGGCHYQLYQFDLDKGSFTLFPNKPEEGWSEGQGLVLSQSGHLLMNYGNFNDSCQTVVSFVDLYDLGSTGRRAFNLYEESILGIALNPNASQALIARQDACNVAQSNWATTCGLTNGLTLLPMQIWNLQTDQRADFLPGVNPAWSPDGNWVAFRSCLAAQAGNSYLPAGENLPSVYLWDLSGGGILLVAPGSAPAWKP